MELVTQERNDFMFQPADSLAQEPAEPQLPAKIFFLLPRNINFYMGKARYPAIKDRATIFFLALLLVFVVAVFVYSIYQDYVTDQIVQHGQITTGTVTSLFISSGKSTSYYLT